AGDGASVSLGETGDLGLNLADSRGRGRRYSVPEAVDADELQEFHPRARVVAEHAKHLAGDHGHATLVHAARGHALVRGVDDDGDAGRLQVVLDALRDLRGQRLLHLQALGIGLDDTRQLADADHAVRRQVTDVGAADDGRQVVLAVAFKVDAAQHDHLVVAGHFLERAAEVFARIDAVAAEPFAIRLGHPLGRVQQAFARRVVAG